MKKLLLLTLFMALAANAQIAKYTVEITRPANATAYAAGDVIAGTDSLAVQLIAPDQYASGKIVSAMFLADTLNEANASFRLFLYSDSVNLGKVADNSAWSPTYAQQEYLVGYIDFALTDSSTASATSVYSYKTGTDKHVPFYMTFRLNEQRGLWGRLTAGAAYQPKNGGTFRIILYIEETE